MKVLVLGGTGVISREIVKLLIDKDHEVTLYQPRQSQLARGGASPADHRRPGRPRGI